MTIFTNCDQAIDNHTFADDHTSTGHEVRYSVPTLIIDFPSL